MRITTVKHFCTQFSFPTTCCRNPFNIYSIRCEPSADDTAVRLSLFTFNLFSSHFLHFTSFFNPDSASPELLVYKCNRPTYKRENLWRWYAHFKRSRDSTYWRILRIAGHSLTLFVDFSDKLGTEITPPLSIAAMHSSQIKLFFIMV